MGHRTMRPMAPPIAAAFFATLEVAAAMTSAVPKAVQCAHSTLQYVKQLTSAELIKANKNGADRLTKSSPTAIRTRSQ